MKQHIAYNFDIFDDLGAPFLLRNDHLCAGNLDCYAAKPLLYIIWAMVNTHYMVDGHPIHNKDPYNGYYKSLWTIGWLAPINGY